MGLLTGKNALVFGVANHRSIAWGITQALHREGATIGLSYGLPNLERRVRPLAESLDIEFVEECDVTQDDHLDRLFASVQDHFGTIDILVHSIAFAGREALDGHYVDTSRESFMMALNVSAYSLVALTQRAQPLMSNGGTILAMSYYGGEKVVPHYNVMGVAKAALESSVRYLAHDLGPSGIRVNAISAGPIKTLSAGGVAGFRKMAGFAEDVTPIRRLVTQDDVGAMAVWLASDYGEAVTGQTIYVDGGLSIMAFPLREEDL